MIKSFKNKLAVKIFEKEYISALPDDLYRLARRKLWYLDNAVSLLDLKIPPGNKLEKLKGQRAGQYSIRINKKWRICFLWNTNNAYEVEVIDYH